jgi:hypothetical protein
MPEQQMAAGREAARAGRGCEAEGGREGGMRGLHRRAPLPFTC